MCGIRIINTNPSLELYVCYRSPGNTLMKNEWDTIVNNLDNNKNCILVGDFNAHNQFWNCAKTDLNGERFFQSIDEHDLFVHNSDTQTYINMNQNIKSNIDLIISTMKIADRINVKIHDETYGSDHFPLSFEVQTQKSRYTKKSFKIKKIRTDWKNFNIELNEKYMEFLQNDYDNLSPHEKYDFFTLIVTESIINSNPKSKFVNPKKVCNPAAWWNSECDKVKRQRKEALKKWESSLNSTDLIEYKRMHAIATKTFKTVKKDHYKNFTETVTFRTNQKYVWDTCKILKNKWVKVTPCHTPQNLPRNHKIEPALEKISPPWASTNPTYIPRCNINEFFDAPFDFYEFNSALESKNKKSAPGIDGLDYEIIINLPIKYHLLLLDIYNEMYSANDYPSSWKNSYVHFIDKPDGKGVRPIALTSCLCKLFETLIKNLLQWWCEFNELLPKSQTGFRKGKSCVDNLTNLALSVNETLMKDKSLLAAFLDVCGAFDNVNCDILLEKLAEVGCSESLVKFVKFITHERNIFSEITGENFRTVGKGVPQGGVLSPLLYIIYVRKITDNLPKSVKISQFADDIAIYSNFSSPKKCLNVLEKAVNIVNKNLTDIGLSLAPQKTVLMHFNSGKILPGETSITIEDFTIKSSETVRFLGLILDYKFSFTQHVNYVQKKCMKAINIVKFLCGTWWGSDPQTLIALYKSYVRSIVDYGSFIYFPTQKTFREKIEQIQFSAIRAALGYRISTPKNVMIAES